jgi:hypothetical protein
MAVQAISLSWFGRLGCLALASLRRPLNESNVDHPIESTPFGKFFALFLEIPLKSLLGKAFEPLRIPLMAVMPVSEGNGQAISSIIGPRDPI